MRFTNERFSKNYIMDIFLREVQQTHSACNRTMASYCVINTYSLKAAFIIALMIHKGHSPTVNGHLKLSFR